MIAKYGLSSILACAATATIALLFVVTALVATVRKKRVRTAADRTAIAFASICIALALVVLAAAVLTLYGVGGYALSSAGDKLTFLHGDKQVFAVPQVGIVARMMHRVPHLAVALPCAVVVACILAIVMIKARTVSRARGVASDTEMDKRKAELNARLQKAEALPDEPAPAMPESEEQEPQETPAPAVSSQPAMQVVPEEASAVPEFGAKSILEEVDKLVDDTGDGEEHMSDDVDVLLRRAIEEGAAMYDTLKQASGDEHADAPAPPAQSVREESAPKEERIHEEELPKEKETKEARSEEKEHEEKKEEPPEPRVHVVRKSAIGEVTVPAPPARKTATSEGKPAAAPSRKRAPKPDKTVEAQESSGLPLTRKYVILNRHSAATIFNEYLNSKREQDKEKLTDSLSTIIIK